MTISADTDGPGSAAAVSTVPPQQLTTQIGIGRKILLLAEHDEDGLARIDEHTRLNQARRGRTEGQVRR